MLQYLLPKSSFSCTQMNNLEYYYLLGGTYCSHQNLSDRQKGRTLGSLLALSSMIDLSIDVRFVVQGYGL